MEKVENRYYVALGTAHDELLRCKDCKKLVTFESLKKIGCCSCGNRRVTEITLLTSAEYEDIKSGKIAFPHSAEFLAEFPLEGAIADE